MNLNYEEQIKECAINLMTLRLRQCLLNLIYDLCDHTTQERGYAEPKTISEIKLEFFRLAKGLAAQLENSLDNRAEYTDSLKSLNERLVNEAAPVFRFEKCISLTGEYVSNKYKLNHIESFNGGFKDKGVDIHMVLHDCMDYLSSFDDEEALYFNKAEIISCFPHLMPRAEFNDYVKKALKIFYRDVPSEFLKKNNAALKCILAPFLQADISESFPLLFSGIKEIWDMDLSEKTNEELEELLSIVDQTQTASDKICSDYNMLYNDINFLYAIGKYCTDEIQLFNNDFELKDLYYSACELAESDTAEAFSETIREQSENKIEALTEAIEQEQKKLEKAASRLSGTKVDSLDESTDIFLRLMAEVTRLYLDELYREISTVTTLLSDEKPASQAEINASIEEISDFCAGLNEIYAPSRLKLVKQIFTSSLPCPYSTNELSDYIHNTLEALNGKPSLILALDNVGRIFEENGYTEKDIHHHHHHNHHHNYHHNHECSCGHHHH